MLVVMRMFLDPIRDGLMRTLETAGVDGVAVEVRGAAEVNIMASLGVYVRSDNI